MAILITGAGLVGCQAARILAERGETPVLFEILPQLDNIAGIVDLGKVRIVRGDVLEPMDLMRAIREEGIDKIIHTATLFGLTAGMQQRPHAGIKLNILGTANVLEVARLLGLKRVVFTSSSTVYLRPLPLLKGETLTEDFPIMTLSGRSPNVYATTKLACEQLGLNYWDMFGVDFVAVRFAGVFGPWRGPVSGVVGGRMQGVVQQALSGAPTVLDEGTLWPGRMDVVYSKDAAMAAVLACFVENPETRVYNVSMGRTYSVAEIAEIMRGLLPQAEISIRESGREGIAGYTMPQQAMDLSRSRAEIGYEPQYDMRAALADYAGWLQRG
jgi:nucleoside-diphosphate-sugar epimerase